MRAVGSAERIGRKSAQLVVNALQVALGQHHIAVENYEILAPCALRSVVAALSRSGVLLHVIVQVELSGISCAHFLAVARRAVLHHDHLKVGERLVCHALQKFVHFVRTVVNGNDEAVFHNLQLFSGWCMKTVKRQCNIIKTRKGKKRHAALRVRFLPFPVIVFRYVLFLHALQIAAVAGVNLYEIALVDEQRYANLNTSLESSRLCSVCRCIAFDARL